MNKKVEYYRITEGKYQEEGQTVVLNGMSGYNVEREYEKDNAIGKNISPEKFIGVFEKATKHPDKIKITKMKNEDNKEINKYQVILKDGNEKNTAVVVITPKTAKKHPEYITRMDNISAANITYRKTNNAKKVVTKSKCFLKDIGITALVIGGAAGIIAFGCHKIIEHNPDLFNLKPEEYIEKRHQERQEQIDELCRTEYNYNHAPECIERRGGYDQILQDKLEEELYEEQHKTR